eukprot:7863622-Pyramimonas_sp.AAC.1
MGLAAEVLGSAPATVLGRLRRHQACSNTGRAAPRWREVAPGRSNSPEAPKGPQEDALEVHDRDESLEMRRRHLE